MKPEIEQITVGSSTVRFHHYGNKPGPIFLLRLHGDEYDASDAGIWWVKNYGGEFLDIENDTRAVYFDIAHELYAFDPNRIFSTEGITNTLNEYCDDSSPNAVKEIEKLARFITRKLRKYALVVALHNNEDFNIHFYEEGGECFETAKDVYVNPDMHPHDFAIVSQEDDFIALKAQQINVVCELATHNDQPGSLSEYCTQQAIRYINIETKKGRGKTQREILKVVMNLPI